MLLNLIVFNHLYIYRSFSNKPVQEYSAYKSWLIYDITFPNHVTGFILKFNLYKSTKEKPNHVNT